MHILLDLDLTTPFFTVPKIHKETCRRSFKYKAPSDWNNLPSFSKSINFF